MNHTQSWVLVIEVGVIAVAYLVGLVGRGPKP